MSFRFGFGLALVASALAASGSASAQECTADTDCPKSWTCEVTGGSACGGSAPACEAGKECPVPEPVDCVTQEFKSCEPGPCTQDSDCDEGMICYKDSVESCTGVSTQPACIGPDCPDAATADTTGSCTTEERSACVPRWAAPCEVAADCGDGFDCVAEEQCACAGSGGGTSSSSGGSSDPSAGGAEPAPAADAGTGTDIAPAVDGGVSKGDGCTCTPSDTKYCRVKMVECASAGDCPTDWTCEEQISGDTDIGCVRPEPAAADGGAASGTDTGCAIVDAGATTTSVSYCMPPFADLGFGVGRDAQSESAGSGKGGVADGNGAPTAAGSDDGSEASTTAKDSGMCSVSRVGGHASNYGALALSVLGVCLALRRSRRHARR